MLNSRESMYQWYRSTLGKELLALERVELEKLLVNYLSKHLLQLGGPDDVFLEKAPIRYRIRISEDINFKSAQIKSDYCHLSLLPDSIELALVHHVLEFSPSPQIILQELHTIIAPEGHIIILAFNPLSLWGASKIYKRNQGFPWCGHFRTPLRLRYWLRTLGFSLIDYQTLFFRPALTNKDTLDKLLFLETVGKVLWSTAGAVYLLVAKKSVLMLTPVKKTSLLKPRIVDDGCLEPSAQMSAKYKSAEVLAADETKLLPEHDK